MGGTAASVVASAGGIMLPAPVVRAGGGVMTYQSNKGLPRDGNVLDVNVLNPATVAVHGLPQVVMDNIAEFKPKLELMRYVSKRTTASSWSRTMRNAGYVHPSHGPSPSGNGSHTHGGVHATLPAATVAIRHTEWDVTGWGQVIDVTQGMTGFLYLRGIVYRMPSAGAAQVTNVIDLLCPSGKSWNGLPGRRFPYATPYKPGYYKFRWSVIDPTDDRGQRITGPLSDTVSITTDVFPFIPGDAWLDPLDSTYHATATLDPRTKADWLRVWVGSVSRLPR